MSKLAKLKEQGIITEQEFLQIKQPYKKNLKKIKFVIITVIAVFFWYFVIIKVQDLLRAQSEVDFWDEQLRTDAEGKYYHKITA